MDLLQQRFSDLHEKYRGTQLEIQKIADWGYSEITNSKFIIDKLRAELDSVKQESLESETS